MTFSPSDSNYEVKIAKNGKYYFYVQNEKKENIGKSFFYGTEQEMRSAIALLLGDFAAGGAAAGPQDEYLECASYKNDNNGFNKFDAQEEAYFGYNYNGKTYLRSEGYTSAKGRDNGIDSVVKNAPIEERWKTFDENNEHFYALKAGNNQEIARSCPYNNQAAMMADYKWIRGAESTIGAGSKLVGASLMSASMLAIKMKEDEAQRLALAEAKRKAEEEAKRKAEEEAKRKAEEEAKTQSRRRGETQSRRRSEA